jgi:DNA-binding transcriptional ArsR family regulator
MTETETPGDRVVLNAQNLRGLAHPLRVRILGLLREDGPSTATRLAERLGLTSGATSYHLRQLAAYGFVTEDTDRPETGRERWWMSAHRFTELRQSEVRRAPIESEAFLRTVALENFERVEAFLSALPSLPDAWEQGWSLGDLQFRLTPAEAVQLRADLREVIARYRQDAPGVEAPADAERVFFQVQLMPQVARPE